MFPVLRQKVKGPAAECTETLVSPQVEYAGPCISVHREEKSILELLFIIKVVLSRICAYVPHLFTSI